MNISIKSANKQLLIKHKQGLVDLINYSLSENNFNENDKRSALDRYENLMEYFEKGCANVFIAFDGYKVVGYVWFFNKNDDRIHLNEIAVLKEYQSKSIGSKLIKLVEEYAVARGRSQIELFCMENNNTAKGFYERKGFEPEKILFVKGINKV